MAKTQNQNIERLAMAYNIAREFAITHGLEPVTCGFCGVEITKEDSQIFDGRCERDWAQGV